MRFLFLLGFIERRAQIGNWWEIKVLKYSINLNIIMKVSYLNILFILYIRSGANYLILINFLVFDN